MTDQFKSIVDHFLSSDIEFTLMVNGDWGSGKTYYFKNQFEEDSKKKIVYTSVFGIKDLKEIDDAIVYQKLSLTGKLGELAKNPNTKVITSLGKTIGKGLLKKFAGVSDEDIKDMGSALSQADISQAISLSDDEVLIIDDVERLDSSISYDDFFGYVSSNYSEGSGIKVILVCKEDEIDDRYKDADDKLFPRYQKIKEKTVWKTINFKLDLEKILPSFYDKYSDPFKSYLESNHNHLIKLCKEFDINNLRTLRFFFENLKRPFRENAGLFEVTDQDKILFESILILSNHYKNGNSLKNDKGKFKFYLSDKFKTLRAIKAKHMTVEGIEKAPLEYEANQFNIKYFSTKRNYRPLTFAFILISSGYFDKEQFKLTVQELETFYSKNDAWTKAIYRFFDPINEKNEATYFKTFDEVLKFLAKGKYGIHEIMAIANNYEIWKTEGIKMPINRTVFYSKLTTAIKTSSMNIGYKIQPYPTEKEALKRPNSKNYIELRKKAEKFAETICIEDDKKIIQKNMNWLLTSDVIPAEAIVSILQSKDPKDYQRLIAKLTDSNLNLFEFKRIYQRMISLYMNGDFETKKVKLTKLFTDMQSVVIDDSIKTYIISSIESDYISTLAIYKAD